MCMQQRMGEIARLRRIVFAFANRRPSFKIFVESWLTRKLDRKREMKQEIL